MRTKKALIMLVFILPIGVFGQTESGSAQSINSLSGTATNFESYCLKEAISYIEISQVKAGSISLAGEVASLENNRSATYADYGIQLKDEESQYFKLTGSNKILSVKSIFVLRLNFNNSTK